MAEIEPFVEDERKARFASIPSMIYKGTTLGINERVERSFCRLPASTLVSCPMPMPAVADALLCLLPRRTDPPNRVKTPEHKAAIERWLDKELSLGRLVGPFSQDELEAVAGPCRSAPISVVEKNVAPGEPPKFRIVEDISHPREELPDGTHSVNSTLDPNDYPADWFSLTDVTETLRDLPNDANAFLPEAMGVDVRDAFLHMPLAPEVRPSLVVRAEDGLYVRRVAAFGARTTPGIFCNAMDATRMILTLRFGADAVTILNQVDDVLLARLVPNVDRDEVIAIFDELGWQLSEEKEFAWSRAFTHTGVDFDLDARTVSLQERKRAKYVAFIVKLLDQKVYTEKEAEKIAGYLGYVAQIDKTKRVDMDAIYRARAAIKLANPSGKPWTIPRSFKECLQRWQSYLEITPVQVALDIPTNTSPLEIYSDASSTGLGIYVRRGGIGGEEFAKYAPLLIPTNVDPNVDIGVAEAWACEWVLDACIALGAQDQRLILFCDNEGVVCAWRKGRSASRLTNRCFFRMVDRATKHNLLIEMRRVKSEDNPSDRVSRFAPGHLDGLLPFPVAFANPAGVQHGRAS